MNRKPASKLIAMIVCIAMLMAMTCTAAFAAENEDIIVDIESASSENIEANVDDVDVYVPENDANFGGPDAPQAATARTWKQSVNGTWYRAVSGKSTGTSGTFTVNYHNSGNATLNTIDIRMYSGSTLVWSQNNAVPAGGRTFNVGSNVTDIDIRVCDNSGTPKISSIELDLSYSFSSPVIPPTTI